MDLSNADVKSGRCAKPRERDSIVKQEEAADDDDDAALFRLPLE